MCHKYNFKIYEDIHILEVKINEFEFVKNN